MSNPPGQPSIAYRVDDFAGFRRALLRPLAGEHALGLWRPNAPDLGLQILEWCAYLGDILTFYSERVANDSYLRTAHRPASIAGLVGLLGYEPAPGLAATGQVAAVRSGAHPSEPLVLPAGMQIASSATPGVPAQIFEVTAATTYSGPTDVNAALLSSDVLDVTASGQPASVLLSGQVRSVKAGDRLVLVPFGWSGGDANWSLVTVASAGPEVDPGTGAVNTRVAFTASSVFGTSPAQTGVTSWPRPLMEALHWPGASSGENAGVLGWYRGHLPHPVPAVPPATGYQLLRPTASAALWGPGGSGVSPSSAVSDDGATVNLSATVRSLRPGDLVLLDGGATDPSVLAAVVSTQDQIGTMTFPEQLSPPAPDLVLPYTALGVDSDDPSTVAGFGSRASSITVRFGFRPVGTVIANPVVTTASLPAEVTVPATFDLPGGVTSALVVDANGLASVAGVAPGGPSTLVLTPPPSTSPGADSPMTAPLTLYFDLVPVARGQTVASETLGSGNAAVANQSFALQKSPLTYVASGAGWATSLKVYVDQVRWSEVPTFWGQPSDARVYVVERSPDQTATVRFGDGVNGARLPTGTGNVVATYRYGSGAASPPAGRLTTPINQQPNLASIRNPMAVTGGRDPQQPGDIKANGPASVLSFGRSVSAVDYEVIAAQAPGVTRAKAYWTFDADRQRNLVKIYVNDDAGGVQSAAAALAGSDDPNRPVAVAAAQPVDVWVSCALVVDPLRQVDEVVAAATAALSDPAAGAFSPARMGIGQWLYRSYIEAALSVPGVVAVHHLDVTWSPNLGGLERWRIRRVLDYVADPGEGGYFDLSAAGLSITGGYAGG